MSPKFQGCAWCIKCIYICPLVYLTVQIESVELGRIYYAPSDTEKGMVQLQAGLHAEVWVTTKEKSMSVACVNIEVVDILAMVSKQVISSCVALKTGNGPKNNITEGKL